MDNSLILGLSLLLPIVVLLLLVLFYVNLNLYRRIQRERINVRTQTTIRRGNKKLYIINTERK